MKDMRYHPRLRAATLLTGSVLAGTRGAAYLVSPPNTGLTTFVDQAVPLQVWGVLWIAVALIILGGFLSGAVARVGLSFGAALWAVWGTSYMWATIVGDSSRGWVTGSLMLCAAGTMWILAALIEASRSRSSGPEQ